MIKKYVFGKPIETDAVVENIPESSGTPEDFSITSDKNGISFCAELAGRDIIYGLGEAVRGINKRGHIYESFNSDDFCHTEEKRSLYGSHNFLIISGSKNIGVFVDCGHIVTFDAGYTDLDKLIISSPCEDLVFYTINGDSPEDIVRQFRKMIGTSYIAPKWAFGFQQCRWSYYTADEVRQVVKGYRENNIPIDAVYLDIDYMEGYKDFTVSNERFPDFENFTAEMQNEGIHLVPIIDAGVKIEDGYDIYEEGKKNGYFCKRKDGTDFTAGVWPGKTHFPDFLNLEARRWFGSKYKFLLDKGIDGFWNDMNEPAMFYTEEGIRSAVEFLKNFDFDSNNSNDFFALKDKLSSLANRREDYSAIYHNMGGEMVCHDRVHNLFGYNMTRAAGEAFKELSPDKRILMFSRSSYIGMHRYGGLWTGDNQSWWSHLLLNIKMMPSLNMCGFIYSGADLGGFGSNCTEDLLLRWLAFGIFTPLMRNHSALGTRKQECYAFRDTAPFRGIISLRYRLIPYLYSEYMKACIKGEMLFRPLAFEYPDDETASEIEDQLLLGGSIMIAPIYQQNAHGRFVYLPDDMLFVLFRNAEAVKREVMKKGVHYIKAELDEVPVFIRRNKLLPLCRPACCTAELNENDFEVISFGDDNVTYALYNDDGTTQDFDLVKGTRLIEK